MGPSIFEGISGYWPVRRCRKRGGSGSSVRGRCNSAAADAYRQRDNTTTLEMYTKCFVLQL